MPMIKMEMEYMDMTMVTLLLDLSDRNRTHASGCKHY